MPNVSKIEVDEIGGATGTTLTLTTGHVITGSTGQFQISGGTAGQALPTDGTGNLTFVDMTSDPTMGGDLTGTASTAQIAANAVGTAEIATAAVTANEIIAGAIGSTELATTGTASSSTFLAGNMAWETVPGPEITTPNNFFKNWNQISSSFTTTVGASENAVVIGPVAVATGNTWGVNTGSTVKVI